VHGQNVAEPATFAAFVDSWVHQVAKFLDAWGFDGGPGTLKGPKGLGHFTLAAMTNRWGAATLVQQHLILE
jgi:hypothetical protein